MSEDGVVPVYIGLRPLYDDGQFYSIQEHDDGTMTVRIHSPSGDVVERDDRMPRDKALAYIRRLQGAGLPEGYWCASLDP